MEALERAKKIVLDAVGDMTQKGVGIMFVVPVSEACGLIEPEPLPSDIP
jgi:hypothetical protein